MQRLAWFFLLLVLAVPATAQDKSEGDKKKEKSDEPKPLPQIAEKTESFTRLAGFLTLYLDDERGTVFAEIDPDGDEVIYATGLGSGLGSNPVGLDRGQWGKTRLVRFKRVGRRVYLIEQNLGFRASADNAAEKRAVDESFADSVFWATDIVAASENRVLIDLKTLLLRDAHRVVAKLKATDQGDYKFEKDLSFIEADRCRSFPRNAELNAMVTFSSGKPGSLVGRAAADGGTFSLRLHHSFVKLPEPGYKPRRADPRVASFGISFADYSAPLNKPLEKRWIARHRLKKADPAAKLSPAVEPIVYYLDPGTPQPVRDALLEGARWWNEAYEAAGFLDAFQVRMLPEDADPMDVRYNIIQWVHRRTRGWSYGQSITDPRTGEIIKGHVLLGSLRVRQDRLIIDGITGLGGQPVNVANCCGIAGSGVDEAIALFDSNVSPIDVSLARLRQLSAHEVGHTLGFSHNFAASTYADRASVMDYPAPRVKLRDDGTLDLSDAYGVGIGEWDKFMVQYAYSQFPEGGEDAGLDRLIQDANQRGLLFLSDADARPAGAANPLSNLWDNGTNPIDELRHLQKVRRIALAKLDEGDLFEGQNLSDLEVVLVPVYLYHRYQIDAVAKVIGGFDYDYAVAGARRKPVVPVPFDQQRQALDALLAVLAPEELILPQQLLRQLPPRPWRGATDRERFESRTAMIFDPDSVIRVAAEIVIENILQPQRAARLEAYGHGEWNLAVVLDRMTPQIMARRAPPREQHVQRIVQHAFLRSLMDLASDESTSHSVRATAGDRLVRIAVRIERELRTVEDRSHLTQMLSEIRRFQERPHREAEPPRKTSPPPGSPIGSQP